MRKRAVLALMLAIAMLVLSSCSLIVKDEKVDLETPVVTVSGKTMTKGDLQNATSSYLAYMQSMYSMYGYSYDVKDTQNIADAQQSAIDAFIKDSVIAQKIEEGSFTLTEEDLATVTEAAESEYAGYVDTAKMLYFSDTELTGDELNAAVENVLKINGIDHDTLLESAKQEAQIAKLKDSVVKEVKVTEDEIKAEFDKRVESAKTNYATNAAAYGTALSNGSTVYYAPEGYRYVKHILVKFADADKTAVDAAESALTAANSELTAAKTALEALGEAAEGETEEAAADRKAKQEAVDAATAKVQSLTAEKAAAEEKAYAALQPVIEEIQAKLTAGEDFDALIEQYGQDDGMKASPAKENGYPVCSTSNYVVPFLDASMALANIGDVSEPVRSVYGIHLIKYVGDIASGAVEMASVKDAIEADVLKTKQNDLYNTTVDQWIAAAGAKIDLSSMK